MPWISPKQVFKYAGRALKWTRRPENNQKVNAFAAGTILAWSTYRYLMCQRGWLNNRVHLLNVAVRPLYLCSVVVATLSLNLIFPIRNVPKIPRKNPQDDSLRHKLSIKIETLWAKSVGWLSKVKILPANIGLLVPMLTLFTGLELRGWKWPQTLRKWQVAVSPKKLELGLSFLLTYNLVCLFKPYNDTEKPK